MLQKPDFVHKTLEGLTHLEYTQSDFLQRTSTQNSAALYANEMEAFAKLRGGETIQINNAEDKGEDQQLEKMGKELENSALPLSWMLASKVGDIDALIQN